MNERAEQLLEGPRGRRFCLELAMELDAGLRTAVLGLTLRLDAVVGSSAVMVLGAGTDAVPSAPVVSTKDLASALAALDVDRVNAEATAKALRAAVDSARYWQEPDSEDTLAALPEIRDALAPLAEHVARHRAADWFWQPRTLTQWVVDWRSADDPAPLHRNPGDALAKWAGNERAEEQRAAVERPEDPRANWSGTWWSFPQGVICSVGSMPGGLTLVEDYCGWEDATAVPVRGVGRTFVITTAEEWVSLCRDYPLDVTSSRRHDWYRVSGRDGCWVIPDWQQVSRDWDAVHLTVAGYLSSATRALALDDERSTVLAGWGPDSTIWLTDVVREWNEPRQVWHRSTGDEHWSRTH